MALAVYLLARLKLENETVFNDKLVPIESQPGEQGMMQPDLLQQQRTLWPRVMDLILLQEPRDYSIRLFVCKRQARLLIYRASFEKASGCSDSYAAVSSGLLRITGPYLQTCSSVPLCLCWALSGNLQA